MSWWVFSSRSSMSSIRPLPLLLSQRASARRKTRDRAGSTAAARSSAALSSRLRRSACGAMRRPKAGTSSRTRASVASSQLDFLPSRLLLKGLPLVKSPSARRGRIAKASSSGGAWLSRRIESRSGFSRSTAESRSSVRGESAASSASIAVNWVSSSRARHAGALAACCSSRQSLRIWLGDCST